MSRQETILPPPSTPAGHQAKRVIIIALLRGAAASAYYVFMAERPAEARLQQEQRLEAQAADGGTHQGSHSSLLTTSLNRHVTRGQHSKF